MSREFLGFDHIDCRVRSLAAVESFYDALMPELGLGRKRFCHVDAQGEWHEVSGERPYNTVEYYEDARADRVAFFFGVVEAAGHVPSLTRVAFRVGSARMFELEAFLARIGALEIERSEDLIAYPAIFFADPGGTKLEIVSRAASIA